MANLNSQQKKPFQYFSKIFIVFSVFVGINSQAKMHSSTSIYPDTVPTEIASVSGVVCSEYGGYIVRNKNEFQDLRQKNPCFSIPKINFDESLKNQPKETIPDSAVTIPMSAVRITGIPNGGCHVIRNQHDYEVLLRNMQFLENPAPDIDFATHFLIGYTLRQGKLDSIQSMHCTLDNNCLIITVNIREIYLPTNMGNAKARWFTIPAIDDNFDIVVVENRRKQTITPKMEDQVIMGSMETLLNVLDTLPSTLETIRYTPKNIE